MSKYVKFGIDISAWQGDFDLARAKCEGAEFVIIRGGTGEVPKIDGYFETNYKKAKELGMPCGVYWYTDARSASEMKTECEFFYNSCIKDHKYELPIYIDVEGDMMKLAPSLLTELIKQFCDYMEERGCFVGIYMSAYPMMHNVNSEELERYTWWIADWNDECRIEDAPMWQFGSRTICDQSIDGNYMYDDFPSIIMQNGFNGYGSKFKVGDSAWINYKIEGIDGDTITLTDGVNHIKVKEEFLRKGN